MNLDKLKESESIFFMKYPDGFDDSQMKEIAKKHKLDKMIQFTEDNFSIDKFDSYEDIAESFARLIGKSSLVSVFEKVKFRDLVKTAEVQFKVDFAAALKELLHGDQQKGFEALIEILSEHKMAKWTILTVVLLYSDPSREVLIKPTTVKSVIKYYELEGLKYSPKANYEFYSSYREQFNTMKKEVHPSLSHDNAMFSGFLMMSLENDNK